jgi:hypothetical protein
MNIYLLTQSVNNDYDTYDSAVVSAESEDEARLMHPRGHDITDACIRDDSWVRLDQIDQIKVTLIGVSCMRKCVILSSYNAG